MKVIKSGSSDLEKYIEGRNHLDRGDINKKVISIINDIREKGDNALFEYCRLLDGTTLDKYTVRVSDKEIELAYKQVEKEFVGIINEAMKNIYEFHSKQLQKSWIMTREEGSLLGQLIRPLSKIAIYVPGGTASYPSSVLMNTIPAKVAGVKKIYMATPCKNGSMNPYTLVAAAECGVYEIYKIGGAQAIGAFAFGTDTIPKVDKIVGPGNAFVAAAKREVYGYVDIDMVAGPSEILIIADSTASPKYIAADLLSQAEHDELASPILVTTSQTLAEDVLKYIDRQLGDLSRKDIIMKSLASRGMIILAEDINEGVYIANRIAPEHIEVMVERPMELLDSIENAGSIFLGEYSPEPLGDYFAGPNHVLPTGGTSAFFSPLSVDSFIKKSGFMYYSRKGLEKCAQPVMKLASWEGLDAHKNSIYVRINK